MGFNTTVVIYNDALNEIKEDKEFGEKLYEAIMKNYKSNKTEWLYTNHGRGSQDAGMVVEQHHSSFTVTVEVGGNTGIIREK